MPEQKSDRKITRRQFLFGMGAAGFTLSLGTTARVAEAALAQPDTIDLEHAKITIIMELHDQSERRIPDVDMIFREYADWNLFSQSADQLLQAQISVPLRNGRTDIVRLFSDGNIETLRQKKIHILFGDIVIPQKMLKKSVWQQAIRYGLAGVTLTEAARLGNDAVIMINQGRSEDLEKEQKLMDRRSALRTIGTVVASLASRVPGVGAGLVGLGGMSKLTENLYSFPLRDPTTPLGKFLNELQGVYSYLERAPESLLRDAFIAHRILSLSEKVHSETGKKPHIGIQMGVNHASIRHLHTHGIDACETVLDWFPDEIYADLFKDAQGNVLEDVLMQVTNFMDVDPNSEVRSMFEDTRLRDYLQRRLQG